MSYRLSFRCYWVNYIGYFEEHYQGFPGGGVLAAEVIH